MRFRLVKGDPTEVAFGSKKLLRFNNFMKQKPLYSPEEIFQLLQNVDCIEDVSAIADYLVDNKSDYSDLDNELFTVALRTYLINNFS